MKQIIVWIFIAIFFFLPFSAAAKTTKTQAFSISPGAQYIKAKNIVRASFGKLKGVSKVTYTLMYEGNGIGQGVVGSFSPGKKTSISKDLYLGTCSGKACIKHKNIKNIQLEVKAKYSNGKSFSKIVKVK